MSNDNQKLKLKQRITQKFSYRQLVIASSVSLFVVAVMIVVFNLTGEKEAKATTTETLTSGAFIVNMGITPQTYANGMLPYGLVYDLVINYMVPVKWVIEPTKVKDGKDFTYGGTNFKGGTFIIEAEYLSTAIKARVAYWVGLGVQGVYTTSSINVPVYTTITSFPRIMIDSLSSNQNIAVAYFTNAGIPSSAYGIGQPSSLSACHDLWINPHGDPRWADYSYLYNFITVQHSYIWCQCHAASVMEGCYNYSPPGQQLNYLSTTGLQCWKGGGGFNCDALITESHATASTAPYTYNYPSDPIMQFMGSMANPTMGGSEQWYIPMSTGGWRASTKRLVTTATGTSPKEGVLMAYGPGYGNSSNGCVMYTGGHDLNATGGVVAEWVAAQRSLMNYVLLAGGAKAILFTSFSIPSSFLNAQTQAVSVTVSSGTPPYTYQWTSTAGGTFENPNIASTTYTAPYVLTSTSGILRCIVTDACGRKNFIAVPFVIGPSGLPVYLLYFTAKPTSGNLVHLEWKTSAEKNNDYFTIERSEDGQQFKELEKIKGAGSSTSVHEYNYTDQNPFPGTSYYRLKQTDYNGESETFKTVLATIATEKNTTADLMVYPNIFHDSFNVKIESQEKEEAELQILDLRGAMVYKQKLLLQQGFNVSEIRTPSNLKNGTYVLKVANRVTVLATTRIIKN